MPGNRMARTVLEWEPEWTRMKGRTKERWINGVGWNMANYGLTEHYNKEWYVCRYLVLGEGKILYSGHSLKEWMSGWMNQWWK